MWPIALTSLLLLSAGGIGLTILLGPRHWARRTRKLLDALAVTQPPPSVATVDFSSLDEQPAPVQRYLRKVLRHGQPVVSQVQLQHRGTFNPNDTAAKGKPFRSEQRVVTRPPGFVWNAKIVLVPGIPVYVHDAYRAGEGLLHAALFGAVRVAAVQGTGPFAEAELMRYLAEAAWYPTALLPGQGVTWQPVDDHSAYATLQHGAVQAKLLFTFDAAGLIASVKAEARARIAGSQVDYLPWAGSFSNYQSRGGMLIPLDGEVSWLTPQGPRPYWRGSILEIHYEFAPPCGTHGDSK